MRCSLLVTAALAVAAAIPLQAVEVMDPAEATPGLTGVALTEMAGGEMVEVPLTVLGKIGSGAPDGDIVLVRLDDPTFGETGIIAGMSGSPVYVDGKLLGALAFGWPFSKEPIGGVTPFRRMLQIEGRPAPAAASARRPRLRSLLEASAEGSLGERLVDWLLPQGSGGLQPLPTAVAAGWWVPGGGGWLAEGWRRMGWVTAPGGAGSGSAGLDELRPGSMIAAVLVDGDATLAAGGTVTEVRGDRVWAFGHPSFGLGGTALPLARARVVAVLPSLMSSFKFFTVGEGLGAMVADRKDGIVGRLGESAPMVPVTVDVDERSYAFRAVRHPVLLPLLTAYLAQSSYGTYGRTTGDQTVACRVEVRYQGLDPVVVEGAFASGQASAEAAALAGAVVAYLENSSLAGPALESVHVGLVSAEAIKAARILEIVPDRRVVRPGELLRVRFRLKPYRGDEEARVVNLQVPESVPDGRIDLVGADGAAWTAYDLRMRPLHPADFDDEVRLVNRLLPASSLVAVLERPDPGMALPGGSLSAPPGLVMQLQAALGPNLETVAYNVVGRTVVDLGIPVAGAQRVPLTVRRGDEPLE
jgi:hypothetical protein